VTKKQYDNLVNDFEWLMNGFLVTTSSCWSLF